MKYFYCSRMSRQGHIILTFRGVARITAEVCEARTSKGRCPRRFQQSDKCPVYREEVLNEQQT
jgi:hypothetical protein